MITVRPYRALDKPFLQNICRVTANKGYQVGSAIKAVTILYNDYYTECEPENIFVAVDEKDEPVGYILCSCDWKKFIRANRSVYKKRLKEVSRTKLPELYAAIMLTRLLPKKYRAHLHIDILPNYQRQGIGRKLVDALRDHLHEKGVPFLTVLSVSTSSVGARFYKRYGFRAIRYWVPTQAAFTVPTKR